MGLKTQFARIGSIFLINFSVKWIIDNVLNIILMVKFGYIISLITTTLIYILIGIISVRIYDYYKIDCLLIEKWKKNQKNKTPSKNFHHVISFLNKAVFSVILSFKNTGLFVIVFRDGAYSYNGFTGKYIKLIFLINSLLINIVWNIIIYFFSSVWIFIWETTKNIMFSLFSMIF